MTEFYVESTFKKLDSGPRAVEKHLAILINRNIIKRVGPAKGGYWQVPR